MDIVISNANVTQVAADLLVLKHAEGFHGADRAVAEAVGFEEHLKAGEAKFWSGGGIAASEVLFIGVGPLVEFRYEQIQKFGSEAVKLARLHPKPVRHLVLTMHGCGYGLDVEQAFLSLLAGIVTDWRTTRSDLTKITIAELSPKRSELLKRVLQQALERFGLKEGATPQSAIVSSEQADPPSIVVHFGARAEDKPRLFAAMPFADNFLDEFHIGFCEAA